MHSRLLRSTTLLAFLVVALSPTPATASSLRANKNDNTNWEEANPEDEASKAIAVKVPSEISLSKVPHIQRRLIIDEINGVLVELLPKINSALRNNIPDPFQMPEGGSFGLGCNTLAAFYNFGDMTGLSSISIDSLEVIPGTESTERSSCLSLFDASVKTVINFGQALTGGMTVGLSGKCLTDFKRDVGGTASSDGTSLTGIASLKGAISAVSNRITVADIANALTLDFESVSVAMNDFPESLNSMLGSTSSRLSQYFKDEIKNEVEPIIRNAVIESMPQSSGLLITNENLRAWTSVQRQVFNGGVLGKWLGTEGDV